MNNSRFYKISKENFYIRCLSHTITTPYMGTAIGHANVRYKQTSTNSYEFVTMKSICRYKTFRVGYFDKKLSSHLLFIIYTLKIVFNIDISAEYIV